MDIRDFCKRLALLSQLSSLQKAVSILWWSTEYGGPSEMTAGEMTRIIRDSGLGNPNSTRLAMKLIRSNYTLKNKDMFRLKAGLDRHIREWLEPVLACDEPSVDQEHGYLPAAIWTKTRGYLERVCEQLNGCSQYGFHDAAAVMMRRIVETLIIESYEHLGRRGEITGIDGNYLMLGGLVEKCTEHQGLPLSREAKKALCDIKRIGDRSAHNPRVNTRKADLDTLRIGLRVVVEELINIAALRHA